MGHASHHRQGGPIVVPKRLRKGLGVTPGQKLEPEAVDGRLQVSAPAAETRIEYVDGRPEIFYTQKPPPLGVEQLLEILEAVPRASMTPDEGAERAPSAGTEFL